MTYKVFHCTTPDADGRLFMRNTPARFPDDFTHVATIEARRPEDVFHLTNHINHPWWTNPEVTFVLRANERRSSSVGDVFVNEVSGECLAVATFGFKEVLNGLVHT